jgi:hypothetical protein
MWATVEDVRTLIIAQNAEFLKMLAGIREVLALETPTDIPKAA